MHVLSVCGPRISTFARGDARHNSVCHRADLQLARSRLVMLQHTAREAVNDRHAGTQGLSVNTSCCKESFLRLPCSWQRRQPGMAECLKPLARRVRSFSLLQPASTTRGAPTTAFGVFSTSLQSATAGRAYICWSRIKPGDQQGLHVRADSKALEALRDLHRTNTDVVAWPCGARIACLNC